VQLAHELILENASVTLDVPSLIAYTTASLAIMSGLLLTVWLTRNTPGWLLWCSLALFMGVCGSMLLGHPALLPGIWGDRLGASFVVLAYGLTWQSVRAFYRRSPVTPYIILIAGGWLLLSCAIGAYWHLAVLSVAIRVMLIAVFNGLACYELWRSRQERLPSWTILFGLFLGAAMLSVTRAALVGVLPAPLGALPTTAWAAAAYITAGMTQALVMTVFMIALMGERAAFAGNRLASYDALTGVFNRRSWEEQAERFVTRSRDTGRPLTILMFDLDHFKQVNDRFGHQVGDRVIQVAARLAEQTLRSQDRVFRIGGEEFVCLLPDTAITQGFSAAERLRTAFERKTPDVLGASARATLSIGLVSTEVQEWRVAHLLAQADEALYEAKRAGRNRSVTCMLAQTAQQQLPVA
jgi:diguanylate cyclase (GGDEF)-like protein